MLPFLRDRSATRRGRTPWPGRPGKALDEARDVVADCLGCGAGRGRVHRRRDRGRQPGRRRASTGCGAGRSCARRSSTTPSSTPAPPSAARLAPVDRRRRASTSTGWPTLLDADVAVVSVMLANNEVGTVQPLAEVADVVRRQRARRRPPHRRRAGVPVARRGRRSAGVADLVAVSAHKFGGPEGRRRPGRAPAAKVAPILHGGGQERDRRSGTHNVAGIVAMAAAMQATVAERADVVARVGALRDRLADGLLAAVAGLARDRPARHQGRRQLPRRASPASSREALLVLLDGAGVYASAGSACASGAVEPSHVLAAMGVPRERAARLPAPLARLDTTEADVDLRPRRHPAGRGPAPGRGRSEGPRRHVGRRRLVGGGRPAGRGRPRRHRRHPAAVGRGRGRRRLLLGGRRRRRPPGRPPARHRPRGLDFTDEFDARVVAPYVAAHAAGRTPNPCIECNRHLKFGRLLRRAEALGFDAVATGHHARIEPTAARCRLRRGADPAKDQSYVLHVLGQAELARCLFPVGHLTKAEVRAQAAAARAWCTADKPDSQDVCFITTAGGREAFLSPRIALTPGRVVGLDGAAVGPGRRGRAGHGRPAPGPGHGRRRRRYALSVDPSTATVVAGSRRRPATPTGSSSPTSRGSAASRRPAGEVEAQTSAHGRPVAATFDGAVDRRLRRAPPPGGARPERRPLRRRPGPRRRHRPTEPVQCTPSTRPAVRGDPAAAGRAMSTDLRTRRCPDASNRDRRTRPQPPAAGLVEDGARAGGGEEELGGRRRAALPLQGHQQGEASPPPAAPSPGPGRGPVG